MKTTTRIHRISARVLLAAGLALGGAACDPGPYNIADFNDGDLVLPGNGGGGGIPGCNINAIAPRPDINVANGITLLSPTGATVTAFDVQQPFIINIGGLTAQARVQIELRDPSDTVLTPAGGLVATADQDGRIVGAVIAHNVTPATAGNHTINVINPASAAVLLTATVSVTDTAPRLFCASGATPQSAFLEVEDVTVRLENAAGLADGTYDLFLRPDTAPPIGANGALGTVSRDFVVSGGAGSLNLGTFPVGKALDVVLDVNGDGDFDPGTDLLTNALRSAPCFSVQAASGVTPLVTQLAADVLGSYRDVFDAGLADETRRDVYVVQKPARKSSAPGTSARLYVVPHQNTWLDGATLTDTGDFEVSTPQPGSGFNGPWLVWPRASIAPGCYDVVADMNANGTYDVGVDYLDNIDSLGATTCGFSVADPACAANVTVTAPANNAVTEATATTLQGSASGGSSSGIVSVLGAQAANAFNLTASGGAFNALIPLFQGGNTLQVAFPGAANQTCSKLVNVTATAGCANELIRIQMTWDGDTDSDLHFVRPTAAEPLGTDYDNGGGPNPNDCNFSNCKVSPGGGGNSIDWGQIGNEADDPKLDVDCIACGNGVENIVMTSINENGTYGIYVDQYSGSENPVIVTVFIRGVQVGQVNCGAMTAGSPTDSCRVGFIQWTGGNGGGGVFIEDGIKSSAAFDPEFPPPSF